MSNLRRVLERPQREDEEIRRIRAEEDHELDEVVLAVGMLNQSRQHHHGHVPNVDRHRHSRGKNLLEDYFIPNSLYSISDFRGRYRMQPHLFKKIMYDVYNYDTYFIQKYDAIGVLSLLLEQKLTAALWMLTYGASADHVDDIARMGKSTTLECLVRLCDAIETLYTKDYLRKPTPRDLQRLLQKAEARGFPSMSRSVNCMYWQWKNCPIAWKEDYGNRKGQKSIILKVVASFDTWVWYAFFGVAGSQNDLNVLGQSLISNDVLRGLSPQIMYQINNTVYSGGYYLADGISLRWTTFVKTIPNPQLDKEKSFAAFPEGYRKDVDRCFGILQARWAIIRDAARMFYEDVLWSIMMICIIIHNMIVEDEYDYDALEMFELDPMNMAFTRIYERTVGANGQPLEHEPLIRDGRYNNRMIDRYMEMQSSYVHERCQVDLIEYLWAMKGNHGG